MIPLLLTGTFVCVFPLMLYCLFLAGLNNRPRPTLVAGSWDFAMVVLATLGFWMIGGPAVLYGFPQQTKHIFLRGSLATIRDHFYVNFWPWGLLSVGYFLLVVGGSVWLIRRRRAVTVVYHIDADAAHSAVESAISRLCRNWARQGDRYVLDGQPRAVLEVAVAPGLRTMSLRWLEGGERLQGTFDGELNHVLAGVVCGESPVVGWLLTVAIVLFAIMVFCVVLFLVFVWNLPR